MTERIKQLEQDIEELEQFALQAERPNIQTQLAQLLSKARTQLEQLLSVKVQPIVEPQKTVPAPVAQQQYENADKTVYTSLTKYAWDQEGNKIKIIFSLEGVGAQVPKDQIDVKFDNWSVEMKLRGYKKQNLIFAIKKLCGEIVPKDCKFVHKNNSITITLTKKDNKSWAQLPFKQEKFAASSEKQKKEQDPQAGIMNMMKKMYEDGDQNMKRTIAEAWTKANDKKEEKHDFSDRYDFLKK